MHALGKSIGKRVEPVSAFSLESRDPDEATERLTAVAPDVELRKAGSGPFSADVTAYPLPGLGFFSIALGHGQVLSPEGRGYYSLTLPRAVSLEIREGGRASVFAPGELHLLAPGRLFDLRAEESGTTLVANLDAQLVDRHLGAWPTCAKAARTVSSGIETGAGGGASLTRYMEFLWLELQVADSALHSPLVAAEGANLVAALLARVLGDLTPSRRSDESRGGSRTGEREALRRAEEFIAARVSAPVALADITEAAGVSVRTLSRVFHRRHGMGPIHFLRERRFEASRRDLAAASPGETAVTTIALRYGFSHLSRFAGEYRRRFAETPSRTLARASFHA